MADAYSKLHLDFTDDGTLKVITEGTLSLQKQVRALRQELTLPIYSPEQRTQIRLALQEAEIGLANTKVQSRELFSQLSLIPGPIGNISTQIQGVVMGFRALAGLSLKDLTNQFKNLGLSLFGGTSAISDAKNIVEDVIKGKGRVGQVEREAGQSLRTTDVISGGANVAATAVGIKALTDSKDAVARSTDAQIRYARSIAETASSNLKWKSIENEVIPVLSKVTGEVEKFNVVAQVRGNISTGFGVQKKQLIELTEAEIIAASKLGSLNKAIESMKIAADAAAVAETNLTVSTEANTIATAENEAIHLKFLKQVEIGYFGFKRGLVDASIKGKELGKSIASDIITPLSNLGKKFLDLISPITSVIAQFGRFIGMGIASVIGVIGTAIGSLGVSAAALTTAIEVLGTTLLSVFTAGIGAAVVAGIIYIKTNIDKITFALFNYRMETDKTKASVESFTQSLKAQKEALDLQLQGIEYATKIQENKAKAANAGEAQIIEIQKKAGKEKLDALIANDDVLYAKQKELDDKKGQYAKLSNAEKLKLNDEINTAIIENGRSINKQIMDNALIVSNFEVTDAQEKYRRKLAELDALIELEIRKNDTDKKVLEDHLTERLKLVTEHERLTAKERELIKKQNEEKVTAALVDDITRRIEQEKIFNEKLLAESSKGTEQYYRKKAQIIEENFQLEMEKAKLNEKTRLTNETIAYTKRYTELETLEHEKLQDQLKLKQDQLNGLFMGSEVYYNKERELEDARYKEQKNAAKDNADVLEAIEKEHQKKMTTIKSTEQGERGKMENQEVALGQQLAKINGAWWTKFDDAFYARKKTALYSNYVAQRDITAEGSDARKAIDLKYAQDSLAIEQELQQAKRSVAMQQLDWTQQIFDSLLQLSQVFFKGNKDLQHALLALSSAAQIAKVVIDANAGVAGATAAAAAQAPIPGLGEVAAAKAAAAIAAIHISEAISIAGIVAATAAGWAQIDGGGSGGGSTGGDTINRGKNYGYGGMIDGPSHANGGVQATLEGGEAVMTRGAVTAFAPLLSLMNQAGGGTAFSQAEVGQARFDNPKSSGSINEPQIIKTYVVQSDLTTAQEKQSRLKSLSTL
jgi:hypothetical protein